MDGVTSCSVAVGDTVDGVGTVVLSGELDAATTHSLEAELERFAEMPEVQTVDLNVSGLQFIDSSGLSTIVGAQRRLAERTGATIHVVGAHGAVLKLFTLTGLDGYLDVVPTDEQASP